MAAASSPTELVQKYSDWKQEKEDGDVEGCIRARKLLTTGSEAVYNQVHQDLQFVQANPILESIIHTECEDYFLRTLSFAFVCDDLWLDERESGYYDLNEAEVEDVVLPCGIFNDGEAHWVNELELVTPAIPSSICVQSIGERRVHQYQCGVDFGSTVTTQIHPARLPGATLRIEHIPDHVKDHILNLLDCASRVALCLACPSYMRFFQPCSELHKILCCCRCERSAHLHVTAVGLTRLGVSVAVPHPLTLSIIERGLFLQQRTMGDGVTILLLRALSSFRVGSRYAALCALRSFVP